ncbi:hypothetical protein [Polymorphospora rubra]|uniref:hypothetical protein n=1 Tax=Polymorphospora rubra TaxID=338584 RepID=UPI0033D24EC7
MTKDDDPTDDLHIQASARPDRPTDALVERLDFGDLAELAEYDDPTPDEPLEMVDAPRQVPEPTSRRLKQRNQRR